MLTIYLFFLDKPNVILPDSTVFQTIQGKWLLQVCEDHIKKFVFNADEMTGLVEQTAELQQAEGGRRRCRHKDVRQHMLIILVESGNTAHYCLACM